MRFFTQELVVRFNSPSEPEADEANEAWENALVEYRKHLEGIRDQMPSGVRQLADLCLHDAELLACNQSVEPVAPITSKFSPGPFWLALMVLSVKKGAEIVSLIYVLRDHLRECPPPQKWPFSKERTHWLYDELDLDPSHKPGLFLHRILLSDGRVLEIPFASVIEQRLPLSAIGPESRQTA